MKPKPNRNMYDNVHDDFLERPANYYVKSVLRANEPVTVYKESRVTSPVVRRYNKGENVGIVYSYAVRDGIVWWQVDWFSGKPQGWVMHRPGLFDADIAEQTAGEKLFQERLAAERADREKWDREHGANVVSDVVSGAGNIVKGVGDAATGIGKSLSTIGDHLLPILAVIVIVALLLYFKKI